MINVSQSRNFCVLYFKLKRNLQNTKSNDPKTKNSNLKYCSEPKFPPPINSKLFKEIFEKINLRFTKFVKFKIEINNLETKF